MKSIMISIKPQFLAKILNGEKTIEVRKSTALYKATQKLIEENGYAEIYVYCCKDSKNLLHKNCADIYWVEDKDFRNKNKQLGLQTQPILNGKVLFKFRCYKVEEIKNNLAMRFFTETYNEKELLEKSCLNGDQLFWYLAPQELKVKCCGYAIHISDLEIFDKPRELSEFYSIVKEKVKTDCPFNCKGCCITNYDCKYYVEDDCWGGQLSCSCPIKEIDIKKPLTKAPQSYQFIESEK